jgi:hypothetical protein
MSRHHQRRKLLDDIDEDFRSKLMSCEQTEVQGLRLAIRMVEARRELEQTTIQEDNSNAKAKSDAANR